MPLIVIRAYSSDKEIYDTYLVRVPTLLESPMTQEDLKKALGDKVDTWMEHFERDSKVEEYLTSTYNGVARLTG